MPARSNRKTLRVRRTALAAVCATWAAVIARLVIREPTALTPWVCRNASVSPPRWLARAMESANSDDVSAIQATRAIFATLPSRAKLAVWLVSVCAKAACVDASRDLMVRIARRTLAVQEAAMAARRVDCVLLASARATMAMVALLVK